MGKKVLLILIGVFASIGVLSGCQKAESRKTDGDTKEEKISIVCTIFPEYDWVKEIVGRENTDVEITLLLDNGTDLHSYQPTAEDIVKIADADMFIYVGGESDGWVEDCLKEATNPDMVVINLLDVLGDSIKEEEIVEGMQSEDEADSHDEEAMEYDEHVWLSLKNAAVLCQAISDGLCQLDEKNAQNYIGNTANYLEQLNQLDEQYQQAVNNGEFKTILFGDRFPFRYLVDDYDMTYYAAFAGCSAETEASFETVIYLANKMDELKLPSILVIENSDEAVAETILENTVGKGQKILVLNSMQSVTGEDVKNGTTYLSIMKENLDVLQSALISK